MTVQEGPAARSRTVERRLRRRRQQAQIRLLLVHDANLVKSHHASTVPFAGLVGAGVGSLLALIVRLIEQNTCLLQELVASRGEAPLKPRLVISTLNAKAPTFVPGSPVVTANADLLVASPAIACAIVSPIVPLLSTGVSFVSSAHLEAEPPSVTVAEVDVPAFEISVAPQCVPLQRSSSPSSGVQEETHAEVFVRAATLTKDALAMNKVIGRKRKVLDPARLSALQAARELFGAVEWQEKYRQGVVMLMGALDAELPSSPDTLR